MSASETLLVTGAAGFIGARFVESCNARGVSVVSVDRRDAFASRPEHARLDFGTTLDVEELAPWLSASRAHLAGIVHMGAISSTTELDEALFRRFNVDYLEESVERGAAARHSVRLRLERRRVRRRRARVRRRRRARAAAQAAEPLRRVQAPLRPLGARGGARRDARRRRGRASASSTCTASASATRGRRPASSSTATTRSKAKGEIRLFESHRAGIPHGHQSRDFVDVSDAVEAVWFALEKARDLRDLQRRNREGAHVSRSREGRLQGARRARANRLRADAARLSARATSTSPRRKWTA